MTSRRRFDHWVGAAAAALLLLALASPGAGAAELAGSQGTDTSLPATDSQVVVNGRGPFASLSITVNQTKKLANQAVSITWTGGLPTKSALGSFEGNYLQIMQCWGDDDGTQPDNPGPPPEQCVQGAAGGTYAGLPTSLFSEYIAISRIISRTTWANYDSSVGVLDSAGQVWRPFRAVDGTVVDVQVNPNYNPFTGGDFWLNPYFNSITTNEVPGAKTTADGRGAELFQVLTGKESSGLGCGQKVQPMVGDTPKTPKCWIVIVPRADQAVENVGTPWLQSGDLVPVGTSPVAPAAWQNRIAIPIDFNPVDPSCAFAQVERRIVGNDLALPAVSSWQPSLCAGGARPPFTYAPVADGTARSLVMSNTQGSPGMAVVSQPITGPSVTPENPVVYAPVSISGLVIGFNIERRPDIGASAASEQIKGVRVAELNLTPRLVAKLLTQSYSDQVSIRSTPPYPWLKSNPANMSRDPDFRQFNPEFSLLFVSNGRTFSGLQLPAGNSDAAQQVWEWVFADPEAKAWLNGAPDPWGMTVNPVYITNAASNPSGLAFGDPLPTSFPKADPYCYQGPGQGPGDTITPPLLCGTDWMPYTRNYASAAQVTRSASDGSRLTLNLLAESPSQVWSRTPAQFIGDRAMLSLTDTPSAAQFGLQMARLSRAGDNGADRQFVAADAAGLAAGVASMAPRNEPTVLEPTPTAVAPGAYPLTAISYAAIAPLKLDAAARDDYAAFLEYGAGAGQVPGLDLGQLPRGYAPLPSALQSSAVAAASLVRTLTPAPTPTTTTTAPTVATPVQQSPGNSSSSNRSSNSNTSSRTTVAGVPEPVVEGVPTTEAPVSSSPVTTTTVAENDGPVATTPTQVTPGVPLIRSRYAVMGLGITALGSALGVLEITKRPRRKGSASTEIPIDLDPTDFDPTDVRLPGGE